MRIVLASASQSRALILRGAGVPFDTRPAHIDEERIKRQLKDHLTSAEEIAGTLAEQKALVVSLGRLDDLVVGADQILQFEDELVSKCATLEEASALLIRLRGKRHSLVNGLVLARGGAVVWRHQNRVELTMRTFGDAFLAGYLERGGEALLSAVGCYRLEDEGAQLFDSIDGTYFSVLGLDLLPLLAALRAHGALPA